MSLFEVFDYTKCLLFGHYFNEEGICELCGTEE